MDAMTQPDRDPVSAVERAKELLSDVRHRIALHDHVAAATRTLLAAFAAKEFQTDGGWSKDTFLERVARYDQLTTDLAGIEALLGFWGQEAQASTLTLAPRRLADQNASPSGSSGWQAMRWYPIMRLLYCGGIAAIAVSNYAYLKQLLWAAASDPDTNRRQSSLAVSVIGGIQSARDAFKQLPGHEQDRVPLNEHLFASLAPALDDLLFLGSDYERCFDRFEILLALVHTDLGGWGVPYGRFAWKHSGMRDDGPVHRLFTEAETQGDRWPPLLSGLFSGSAKRFKEVADKLLQSLNRLNWY